MLHIWQSIMLAASFTSLGGTLSESVAFFSLKILLSDVSLGFAFGKSKFPRYL